MKKCRVKGDMLTAAVLSFLVLLSAICQETVYAFSRVVPAYVMSEAELEVRNR